MTFSPAGPKGRPATGVAIEHLSQQVLTHHVNALLDTVQDLNRQIRNRDSLIDFAKNACKKRFVPSLEKQHASLRQPTHVPHASEWSYIAGPTMDPGQKGSHAFGIEIVDNEMDQDEDGSEADSIQQYTVESEVEDEEVDE